MKETKQLKKLMEAVDRVSEIEESDDPFCIGATGDVDPQGYTAVEESQYEDDRGVHDELNREAEEDWSEPKVGNFRLKKEFGYIEISLKGKVLMLIDTADWVGLMDQYRDLQSGRQE